MCGAMEARHADISNRQKKMMNKSTSDLFIDPSYRVFDADGLFDLSNPVLNRDGQMLPFHRMREHLAAQGVRARTADFLFAPERAPAAGDRYISLGCLDHFERVRAEQRAAMAAFVIMEPPVVVPALYAALPRLTAVFDRVYVHNTRGDGYSLEGVDQSKLQRLYWPLPHDQVLAPYWDKRGRQKRIVVINGSHNPRSREREQYSLRIEAMAELAHSGVIDLYGMGWNRWWSREARWLPYWRNLRAIKSIYKGPCASKFEVLQDYDFCLCFENMKMDGYITEKIFDCIYAGTIPLYLGAPDVLDYIPADAFVDCRRYSSWSAMWQAVARMPEQEIEAMRLAGRNFLQSDMAKKFYHSMAQICES